MTLSDNMFQPGVILHEVIAGTLKAKGSSFDAWCIANEINRSSARQATYGQSGGDRGKAILERMINDAGREVVALSYRTRTHSTKAEAEGAAKAKLDELKRGDDTLSITMPGDPLVAAEGQIIALGFRIGVSGLWSITSARHRIDQGGYETQIKTEKPKG